MAPIPQNTPPTPLEKKIADVYSKEGSNKSSLEMLKLLREATERDLLALKPDTRKKAWEAISEIDGFTDRQLEQRSLVRNRLSRTDPEVIKSNFKKIAVNQQMLEDQLKNGTGKGTAGLIESMSMPELQALPPKLLSELATEFRKGSQRSDVYDEGAMRLETAMRTQMDMVMPKQVAGMPLTPSQTPAEVVTAPAPRSK